jgi:arginase family enzyme
MGALDELATILRPPGGGIHLVSSGRAAQEALQRRLLGASTAGEVQRRFMQNLERIPAAKGVLLAVPSDVGAGFRRGANLGPLGIRETLAARHPEWASRAEALGLVDVGDVFCVPHFLHDDMLSEAQLEATRRDLYGDARSPLPVSPLSIAERALDLVFELNPRVKPFVLGGDHSTALPVVRALQHASVRRGEALPWGLVQSDAHTDLLPQRLGVKYCFGTWSWHANELLGRGGRLTQVGIRVSGRDRAHWESTLGVRQFWAEAVLREPGATLEAVVAHVKSLGVGGVYFSNDIDGTDARYAEATGTPEVGGLEPEWVLELIRRLGAEVGILGGDVMEVAPPLGPTREAAERTLDLAVRYLLATIEAGLGSGP